MKIYIEPLLLINFVIDFCIMLVISKLIFAKVSIKRIVFSALFGSFATLLYPICNNAILINALKILTSIIMLQILHINTRKQLFLSVLTMFSLSYVFGGAILANFGSQTASGYAIQEPTNIGIIIFIIIVLSFILCKIIQWLKCKIVTNSNIYNVKLKHKDKIINIKSFIDSGNSLYDNNQPVNLINFDTFNKLTGIGLSSYLNNEFLLDDAHYIQANTIAGSKKILVFTIDELTINNQTFKKVKLGLALNFDNNKEYKMILNSSFCYC